jgi:large subunit ribosomal protein L6
MSRIGNNPVTVPKGVDVKLGHMIAVKGPKGQLETKSNAFVNITEQEGKIVFERAHNSRPARAAHGLMRALVANMVHGVTVGFERKLEINGVGYRAEVAGQKMTMQLGYSHPVIYDLPAGVKAKVDKTASGLLCRQDPKLPTARTLQGQRRQVPRGAYPPQSWQGCRLVPWHTLRLLIPKLVVGSAESTASASASAEPLRVPGSLSFVPTRTSTCKRYQVTLAAASDLDSGIKGSADGKDKSSVAKLVGELVGKKLREKEVNTVVFDRNGFNYHGRVKALAEGAREAGLEF